jgi:hypothetical protein
MKYELDTGEKLIEKEAREYKRISEDRKKNIDSILEKSSKKKLLL